MVRTGSDVLTVEVTRTIQVAAIGCGVAAISILISTAGRGLVYVVILAFGAIGSWFFPSRAVFDRRQGVVCVRRFFRSSRLPLSRITAVSILDGGWHSRRKRSGYRSKELVLSLQGSADEEDASICVTNHGDHAVTATMAAQIAEFLDVPVRDQTQNSPHFRAADQNEAGV
jgi:hypothetical protein